MDPLAKSPKKHPDWMAELLAGGCVAPAPLPSKGDLSDWVELMEAVEVLCPVWPERDMAQGRGNWRL